MGTLRQGCGRRVGDRVKDTTMGTASDTGDTASGTETGTLSMAQGQSHRDGDMATAVGTGTSVPHWEWGGRMVKGTP